MVFQKLPNSKQLIDNHIPDIKIFYTELISTKAKFVSVLTDVGKFQKMLIIITEQITKQTTKYPLLLFKSLDM